MKRIALWTSAVVLICGLGMGCNRSEAPTGSPGADGKVKDGAANRAGSSPLLINGAGATFPYPLYSKWFDTYTTVDPSVRFNYQSIGSGGGIKQVLEQTVDFGASDAPMEDENLQKAPGRILHLPTVAGAVVIVYNLPNVRGLRLDGHTIAGIFMGRIKKWNDAAIARINPGLALPAEDIVVIHRSDGSGTTHIFTDYLSKVSAEWKGAIGTGKSVRWPVGLGAKGNEGVAGQVKHLPASIGYVEFAYAAQNKLAHAGIINRSGAVVQPTVEAVVAALASATIPEDFRFSIVDSPGSEAYPIAGATWLLVYEQQKDPVRGKKLVEFLKWALTEGDRMATDLHYAPLPAELKRRVLAQIEKIQWESAQRGFRSLG